MNRRGKLQICHPDAAGIDIGSKEHWVAVPEDRDDESVQKFGTFTGDLYRLAEWLKACGVTTVAMESTGVYWVPLHEVLEERGFTVLLVNAAHVRNVPGRKSDVKDCQWIQQLHGYGLLRGSFRPNAEIVELRSYARHRQMLVESAASHIQHMQKALMLMNVQVHHVLSDITGVTGMRIIRALVAGQYDPFELAKLRDPRCRATREEIEKALTGTYKTDHLFALKQSLCLYDAYQASIAECDQRLEDKLRALSLSSVEPAEPKPIALAKKPPSRGRRKNKSEPSFDILTPLTKLVGGVDLSTIPGIGSLTSLNLLAEIGTDMTRWPSEKHFTSWLNLAPGITKTGGQLKSGKRPPTKNRAGLLLRQSAASLSRTTSALGGFYRRVAATRGKGKAVVATARKLAVLVYNLLKRGTAYVELGLEAYDNAYRERRIRSLENHAKSLGFELRAKEAVAPAGT
jgi:transposase